MCEHPPRWALPRPRLSPTRLKPARLRSDGVLVEREVLVTLGASAVAERRDAGEGHVPENGGFPVPPAGVVTRVINATHEVCGQPTEVRIPAHLEPRAVQSVVCERCAERYEPITVERVDVILPAPAAGSAGGNGSAPWDFEDVPAWRKPEMLRRLADPGGLGWRALSIPLTAAAVIVVLLLIQGGGSEDAASPSEVSAPAVSQDVPDQVGSAGAAATAAERATLVRGSSFSLALPAGWKETSSGATFAASSSGGDAEVKLWVSNQPDLAFADFEARSIAQLESLAGESRVVERQAGPTPEGTIVRLAANAPRGAPTHEVTLRAAGPYRYYLSTTLQPGASRATADGADLVHGSFTPVAAKPGKGEGD